MVAMEKNLVAREKSFVAKEKIWLLKKKIWLLRKKVWLLRKNQFFQKFWIVNYPKSCTVRPARVEVQRPAV